MARCPICEGSSKSRAENPSFPFCSVRCKTIDLGKWMNEEYRIPVQGSGERDEANETNEANEANETGDGGDGEDEEDKREPGEAEPVRH